ncbi:MAG: hypothetical protein JWO62_2110 [Acidimicrobiaceae bacterium]|jgi:hypothetical protein|nr:hypothetical protein [Acidimicrobiaceae bacterium]
MTWVAWRVQRAQLLGAVVVAAIVMIWLAATGLAMGHDPTWKYWPEGEIFVLDALPALLGLTIGAPVIAGEIYRPTYRLAWSQGVSRTAWLRSKLVVGGAVTVLLAALVTLVLEWWASAVSLAPSTSSGGFSDIRVQPTAFDVTGLVVVAYAVFAYGLGVALGAVLRRPGWSIATGLAIFAVVRLAVERLVRPTLVSPSTVANFTSVFSGTFSHTVSNGWLLGAGWLPLGRTVPAPGSTWSGQLPAAIVACDDHIAAKRTAAFNAAQAHCGLAAHLHWVAEYQPMSHYWPLQLGESAIILAMAGVLFAGTVYVVRRWRA